MAATTGMRRPLRRALAAAAVAASLLLAGCGGSEPPPPPEAPDLDLELETTTTSGDAAGGASATTPISAAADATTSAGTARISTETSTQLQQITTEFVGEGVFDFANQRGTMEMTLGGRPSKTVMDGGVVYSELASEMASTLGRKWLKVESGAAGFGSPGATGPGPDVFLQALQASAAGVTEVGEEQVRGGDTATHYTATLDIAAHPQAQQLSTLLGESLPVDVWVDAEGRLRKLVTETTVSTGDVGDVQSTSTVELWDFGAPVEITVPPAEQTIGLDEFTELLSQAVSGETG